jgi:ATP-dependent helicase/nuclease subunit B
MLPPKISATNIEMLIRNPYGFYAKNILGLRKLDNIFDKKSLSKFGNFIHKIIEKYTLEFDIKISNKYEQILAIGHFIAKEKYTDDNMVNLWWPKFMAIAREFIEFDLERRENSIHVAPEIYGEMPLRIGNSSILITAIADRIDIQKNGRIHILDYKTGTLPTKADITQGISVQMLVEAMIADINGFRDIEGPPEELIYVKIASRSPYVTSTSIMLDDIDLKAHKEGLIKLLTHYSECTEFKINNNPKFAPKYDDYKYLARAE